MRYLGRSFFLMRALLFVIGLGAISVQTVSAATCAGSGAKPGMDLGALQSVKAGKIKNAKHRGAGRPHFNREL